MWAQSIGGLVEGFCENGNGTLGVIRVREGLQQLGDYQLMIDIVL
jgi:hypothetical protein